MKHDLFGIAGGIFLAATVVVLTPDFDLWRRVLALFFLPLGIQLMVLYMGKK